MAAAGVDECTSTMVMPTVEEDSFGLLVWKSMPTSMMGVREVPVSANSCNLTSAIAVPPVVTEWQHALGPTGLVHLIPSHVTMNFCSYKFPVPPLELLITFGFLGT